jgi:hypothetical protein
MTKQLHDAQEEHGCLGTTVVQLSTMPVMMIAARKLKPNVACNNKLQVTAEAEVRSTVAIFPCALRPRRDQQSDRNEQSQNAGRSTVCRSQAMQLPARRRRLERERTTGSLRNLRSSTSNTDRQGAPGSQSGILSFGGHSAHFRACYSKPTRVVLKLVLRRSCSAFHLYQGVWKEHLFLSFSFLSVSVRP